MTSAANAPWRDHPALRDRFLGAPDQLQVVIHDGGPRLTQAAPELVWVEATGLDGADLFRGKILNQPVNLSSVAEGDTVRFIAPRGGGHLLMVTDRYLAERRDWSITPCDRCGLDELFDAPSDLVRATFPDLPAGAVLEQFTAFCALCGGVQAVRAIATTGAARAPTG
jgi:hypothetical protein